MVDVHEMGPETRRALKQYGRIVSEDPRHKSYTLHLSMEVDPGRRQISVEKICERIGNLGFVTKIYLPGYRTLHSERW